MHAATEDGSNVGLPSRSGEYGRSWGLDLCNSAYISKNATVTLARDPVTDTVSLLTGSGRDRV